MTPEQLEDRIFASLALAGMGDALGAPTEQWTIAEIFAAHGGLLARFIAPPPDTFAGANNGLQAEVTDDASQMYYLAQALVDSKGTLDEAGWVACLLDWAAHSPKAGFMGPSTAGIVQALREGRDTATVGVIGSSHRKMTTIGTTNGAAMRVAPVGLLYPGDPVKAAEQALVTCLPSHDTDVAISAACAIAGAAAAAVDGAALADVIDAGLQGGAHGETLARRHARLAAGPNFLARSRMALEIARQAQGSGDDRGFLERLEREVGNSVLAAESVPSALAILAYAGADPLRTIALAASCGNDTDSIATMAGAIAGAMHGRAALPEGMLSEFCAVNAEYGLDALARSLAGLARRRAV
ncbi:ADP-ribosylglycohydrolase family protein [Massilia sp. CFBP9012]|uniref:ADP-ribosylglycohydrolase family protein n=1 Tax=Massilia sp. CFBP9012 TaxID=3096531 RepID=UPI002A6AE38E|nr:ADP-ribosylglycohydrolase family protein [Massilia sp. CFBP9012]MDY0977260.1 ADP-ribosylglycohydrolase family protein [Massilia sp. CFBP9012]